MSPQNSVELTLAERLELDAVCDQFESDWKAGNSPDLAEYADRLAPPRYRSSVRLAGLAELAVLDAFYRSQSEVDRSTQSHESSTWHEYVDRFPELAQVQVPDEFMDHSSQPLMADRFRILRSYASGGLGRVSLARDLDFRRNVAIKEMHARFANKAEYRKRFLREAEITGQLEHPSIVPVYVKGKGGSGEPYYVMRFVQGRSMLEAIQQQATASTDGPEPLARRQLLSRFIDVCQAVQYAHSRDIIHRDIKPENIMLGDYGETLLVDWGLAKHLNEPPNPEVVGAKQGDPPFDQLVRENTDQTRAGAVMGTPAYMSPEQRSGTNQLVGKPSDIYSLGATLYQLVTGQPPSTTKQTRKQSADGKSCDDSLRAYQRPLLAVCHKAMAPNPLQRYASAKQLATDVESILADEPIDIYADSISTIVRRWTKRHQALAAASVVAACLSIAALSAIFLVVRQNAIQLEEKNSQLDAMIENEKGLRLSAERSESRTQDALSYLVNVLRSPDPNRTGRDARIVDVLDDAVAQVDVDFQEDPLMLATMLESIGRTYYGLSLSADALPIVERARVIYVEKLGSQDRKTLHCEDLLADLYQRLDDPRAMSMSQQVFEKSANAYGQDDPDTLRFQQQLAVRELAAGQAKTAVAILETLRPTLERVFGDFTPASISLKNDLANAYYANGQYSQAVEMSRSVYDYRLESDGPSALSTIKSGCNFATHLARTGSRKTVLAELQTLLQNARESLGDDHYQTLIIMSELGDCLIDENDTQSGFALIEESLRRSQEIYGENHPRTMVSANGLARAYLTNGDYLKSIEKFRDLYDSQLVVHGPAHPETLTVANNLASAYRLQEDFESAIPLFESTLKIQRSSLGEQHADTIRTMLNLVAAYQGDSLAAESIPLCREIYSIACSKYGTDNSQAQTALALEGAAHLQLKDFQQAEKVFAECLSSRKRTMPEHWLYFHTMSQYGETLVGLEKFQQAEPILIDAYQGLLDREPNIPARASSRISDARLRLVKFYESMEMPERADEYRKN